MACSTHNETGYVDSLKQLLGFGPNVNKDAGTTHFEHLIAPDCKVYQDKPFEPQPPPPPAPQPSSQQQIPPELLAVLATLAQSVPNPSVRNFQGVSSAPPLPSNAPAAAPVRFLKRHRNTESEILEKAPPPQDQVVWQDQDDPFAVVEVIKRRSVETGLVLTKTSIEAEMEKSARLRLKTIPRLEFELKSAKDASMENASKEPHWNWATDLIRRAQAVAKGKPQFREAMDQLIGAPKPREDDDFVAPEEGAASAP